MIARLGAAAARSPDGRIATFACVVAAILAGTAVARGNEVATIALLAAALYALLFARSAEVALLGYVATRPIVDAFVLVDAGPVTAGQVWGAGLLVALVMFFVRTDLGRSVPPAVLALIALYGVLAAQGDSEIAVEFGLKLALWVLLIVVVERIARTSEGQAMCFRAGYALALGSAVLIGALVATNNYGAAYYESFGLAQQTEQSPQPLAFLAVFSIAFALIGLLQRWWALLSFALVAALTIEVTLSYVRTALIALIPLMLAYIFVAVRRRRPTAFALAGAFGVTAFAVQERLAERFSDLSLLGSADAESAGSNRVAIWTSVWDATTDSVQTVLTGAGAGASHAVSLDAIGHYVDAHNDLLEFFATGGVLLVGAYVGFLVWAVGGVWRVHRNQNQSHRSRAVAAIALGAVGAFVVTSLLSSISFYAAAVALAVLLGLVRGMAYTPGRTYFDLEGGEPTPSGRSTSVRRAPLVRAHSVQ